MEKIVVFIVVAKRRQRVKFNGKFSDCAIVNHGVPQGTVLGQLIFLLYGNNFSSTIYTTQNVLQFADGTCIFYFLLWK